MQNETDMPSVDAPDLDARDTHGRTSEDFDADCGDDATIDALAAKALTLAALDRALARVSHVPPMRATQPTERVCRSDMFRLTRIEHGQHACQVGR